MTAMVKVMLLDRACRTMAPRLPVVGVGNVSPGQDEGVEDDEEYQVVTRARGKQKPRTTVPRTEVQTPVMSKR